MGPTPEFGGVSRLSPFRSSYGDAAILQPVGSNRLLLRQDVKTLSRPEAVCCEVGNIQGKNIHHSCLLRNPYQRGVCQIHRMIGVLLHQLLHARKRTRKVENPQSTGTGQPQERCNEMPGDLMSSFRQDRPGREQLAKISCEERDDTWMETVAPIGERDQRARVNE